MDTNKHQPKMSHSVTLSAAKGLSGWPLLVTLSRGEGSVALGREMLRGVYTERSECAQHDSVVRLPRHRLYEWRRHFLRLMPIGRIR